MADTVETVAPETTAAPAAPVVRADLPRILNDAPVNPVQSAADWATEVLNRAGIAADGTEIGPPTGSPTQQQQAPAPEAGTPAPTWNEKLKRWVDPNTKAIVKDPEQAAPVATKIKLGEQEYEQDVLQEALKARAERDNWSATAAKQLQDAEALKAQVQAEVHAERARLAQEGERMRLEVEQANHQRDSLLYMARTNPTAFNALLESVGVDGDADSFLAEQSNARSASRQQAPVNPEDQPITVGQLRKMQQDFLKTQREGAFKEAITQDVASTFSPTEYGPVAEDLKDAVMARLERMQRENRLHPGMTVDQIRLIVDTEKRAAANRFGQHLNEKMLKAGKATQQVAAQIPPSSLNGVTGMPAPPKLGQRDLANETPAQFLQRTMGQYSALNASGGGTV